MIEGRNWLLAAAPKGRWLGPGSRLATAWREPRRNFRFVGVLAAAVVLGWPSYAHAQVACQPVDLGLGDVVNGELSPGECFSDELGRPQGALADLYRLSLPEGGSVTITLESDRIDSYLVVLDESRTNVIGTDDDSGNGLNSRLSLPSLAPGTYILVATSFAPVETGAYSLSASGFVVAVSMTATARDPQGTLVPLDAVAFGDRVIVDVFLGSSESVDLVSVAVVNSNPSALLYDGEASAALPINPAAGQAGLSNGSQSSYILQAPRGGRLVPSQSPYFSTVPPQTPGTEQVNISYESPSVLSSATGTGVYLATLLFHVVADFDLATLELQFTSDNFIQSLNRVHCSATLDLNLANCLLSAPVTVIPEPGVAGMALAILVTLCVLATCRRKALG